MNSFSFAPQQHTQSRIQKNYIFVDEHNRHKRPKVSRACENCRKRRTKCDTAKTDTWPCSQCIKLQIDCVLPNGSDLKTTGTTPMNPSDEYQQTSMQQQQISNLGPVTGYATRPAYPDAGGAPCRAVPYESSQQPGSISYGAVPPPASMMEQPYANQNRSSHANDAAAGGSATSLAGSILPGGGPAPGYAPCPTSLSYTSYPITLTISAGPVDRKSGSPVVQSPVLMSQGTQAPGMFQRMPFTDQPEWNPSRIFEYVIDALAEGPSMSRLRVLTDSQTMEHDFWYAYSFTHHYYPKSDQPS
ncbi:hypothetical protein CEP52_016880 [Fusarium oligoseptatum]|uniref:Zn(2)-C6 fungal-type domain-containing protein n=1 Tax=Fusarium oligoseptatum TaxID=2604345 RepID=A0A428RZF3_9HYPO|nr:hypothetical protein CEP52_016880 [Fusarium oligoseptatum]